MPLAVVAMILMYVAMFGIVHQEDEGTAAHLFQLLIAGQVPIVAFFAVKWLPQAPKQTLRILALQIIAVLIALAPVFYYEL